MKATLKNIAKNLKKSSKVHAKQSKQIESIMKKSPTKLKKKPAIKPAIKPASVFAPGHRRRKVKINIDGTVKRKNKAKLKESPAKQNFMGKVTGKLERKKRKDPVYPSFPMDPRGNRFGVDIDPNLLRDRGPYKPNKDVKRLQEIIKKEGLDKSPAKNKAKNLLKAVPNKAAFDKLSPEDKKGFTKAAKKAGLPTKKATAMKMKTSPALAKLSASCKAAAKRKFKVYPSAYANMWAAKTQRQGKC